MSNESEVTIKKRIINYERVTEQENNRIKQRRNSFILQLSVLIIGLISVLVFKFITLKDSVKFNFDTHDGFKMPMMPDDLFGKMPNMNKMDAFPINISGRAS